MVSMTQFFLSPLQRTGIFTSFYLFCDEFRFVGCQVCKVELVVRVYYVLCRHAVRDVSSCRMSMQTTMWYICLPHCESVFYALSVEASIKFRGVVNFYSFSYHIKAYTKAKMVPKTYEHRRQANKKTKMVPKTYELALSSG
jgi:hypothetical protein